MATAQIKPHWNQLRRIRKQNPGFHWVMALILATHQPDCLVAGLRPARTAAHQRGALAGGGGLLIAFGLFSLQQALS